jgi:hypothetical protein
LVENVFGGIGLAGNCLSVSALSAAFYRNGLSDVLEISWVDQTARAPEKPGLKAAESYGKIGS